MRQLPSERLTELGRRIQLKARDCGFVNGQERDERLKETLITGLLDRDLRCRVKENLSFRHNGFQDVMDFAARIENVRKQEQERDTNVSSHENTSIYCSHCGICNDTYKDPKTILSKMRLSRFVLYLLKDIIANRVNQPQIL